MSPLRTPLKQHLREELDAATEERLWRSIRAREVQGLNARRRGAWAVTAVGAAAAAVFFLTPKVQAPEPAATAVMVPSVGPLRLTDGSPLHSAHAENVGVDMKSPDGTELRLAAGATLEVIDNGAGEVRLRQPEGRVSYDITPGGPRRWTIESGPVVVEVVGTSFVVDHSAEAVSVDVSRGKVVVRGAGVPHGVESLMAGNSVRVPLSLASATAAAEPAAAPTVAASPRGAGAHGAKVAVSVSKVAAEPVPEPALGVSEPQVARPEEMRPEELLAAADAARLSAHASDAAPMLERLLKAYPNDSRVPLAAFTLGRLYLGAGDGPHAVASFDRALAAELPNVMRAEAKSLRDTAAALPAAMGPVRIAPRSEVNVAVSGCPLSAWSADRWVSSLRVELAADNHTVLWPAGRAAPGGQLSASSTDCSNPDRVDVAASKNGGVARRTVDLADISERDRERVLAIVAAELLASLH